MVGPDCRRFLEHSEAILEELQNKINTVKGAHASPNFKERHAAVLRPLKVVSRLMRAVRILDGTERADLTRACKEFGTAWRASYGMCTPKAHMIEVHVPRYVEKYHTIGIFGEDGIESLHPLDSKVRTIRL